MKYNILIVGLGVIGASFALGLKEAGHNIYGIDIDDMTLNYAKEKNIIIAGSKDIKDYIKKVEIIIFCIYPKSIIKIIKENEFLPGQVICDVSGVKENLVKDINTMTLKANYVSLHPMAGREKRGIMFADKTRFYGANYLIIPTNKTNDLALAIAYQFALELKFGHIYEISAKLHDLMIAETSQLPHALAVALVLTDERTDIFHFIGDSYRDLTRIAMINEDLWPQLFLENKNNLVKNIEKFREKLDNIKDCLINEDIDQLKELFRASSAKREAMEKKR